MSDLAAQELRTLRRLLRRAEGRLARQVLRGKVHPGSQDMEARTVRLDLGADSDGKPLLSPPVGWAAPGVGRLKLHAVPADNEQMILFSPSGTIGTASIAVAGSFDDDNGSPSDKASEVVVTFGGTRLELRGDDALVKSAKVVVESQDVHLGGEDGKRVARVGDRVDVKTGSSKGLWPIIEGSNTVRAIT
ncbi:phage baseplate protein [Labrenzia sp. OB1]|uniref:phage baseplate protein n=1 Tax=Labrenzia sp. OB1 TaxID=1561204 RepID=UPI0007B26DE4|nr:phage baseplate protein [Labrenzia sp. OB1]KZM49452.1 phage baseplate assembly protein V [Labrenzia sp. OB1]